MKREVIAALSGAGMLAAIAAGIALQGSGQHDDLHKAIEHAANDTLAAYNCSIGIVGTDGNPYRVERDSAFIAVRRTSEWRVVADCDRAAPPDTTGTQAGAVSLTGLPSMLTVGSTAAVTGALLDVDGEGISTTSADWEVNITGGLRYVSDSALTNVVRAAEAGPGAVRYTHLESGLVANATTQISEPPDTTEPPDTVIGEASRPDPVAGWPLNEPDGMTPILYVDGSSKDWVGFRQGGKWADDSRVSVVIDPDSKYGFAIEKRFLVGDPSGWNGINYRNTDSPARQRYQRVVFKVSANWQWHSGGTKFFYWGGEGRPGNASPTQFFIYASGNGQLHFVNQSTSGEADAHGHFRAVGAPHIDRDRYHTVEVLHVANTPGNSDGSLRIWIDDTEVEGFNHLGRPERTNVKLENLRWLNYGDTRLAGLEAFLFWGGQRDTKEVNDHVRLSEFYISARN